MRRIILSIVGAALLLAPAGLATAEGSASTSAPTAARVSAVKWPVVRRGARGERVRTIQLLLNQRGARLVADGVFGASTATAVKNFQRKNRLAVDGFVGPATWVKLVVTVRRGNRGLAVQALQRQLRFHYGYKSVKVDGVFGASTKTAVKNFQAKRKLVADGIVGLSTWKALVA